MDQNGDNMMMISSEIPISYQQLLYGDDWQLYDTFPTVDNSNSAAPTIDMNYNGLAVDSDPLLMTFPRSSTNIEESETASQQDYLEVSSQEDVFTYEELLVFVEYTEFTKLFVGDLEKSFGRRKYENYTDETEICVICLNKLEYGEEASTIKCGHTHHFKCIKKWLMVKNMCPLCKQKAI